MIVHQPAFIESTVITQDRTGKLWIADHDHTEWSQTNLYKVTRFGK